MIYFYLLFSLFIHSKLYRIVAAAVNTLASHRVISKGSGAESLVVGALPTASSGGFGYTEKG